MVMGRSLESKGWSLESSQRARRVSIRSSISSSSPSDFPATGVGAGDDDEVGCSAIASSFLSLYLLEYQETQSREKGQGARKTPSLCFATFFHFTIVTCGAVLLLYLGNWISFLLLIFLFLKLIVLFFYFFKKIYSITCFKSIRQILYLRLNY